MEDGNEEMKQRKKGKEKTTKQSKVDGFRRTFQNFHGGSSKAIGIFASGIYGKKGGPN